MVRCEEFYKYFEKKGNFCGKSEGIVKQVESYIDYVKRHKLRDFGGYKISNSALDPFMSIEEVKDGKVHSVALKDLRNMVRRNRILPEKITRRVSIEIINGANMKVDEAHKLDKIPNIRSRMGDFEHEIGQIGFEVRNTFDAFKDDIDAKNNNEVMKIMLEWCIRNPDEIKKLKEEMNRKEEKDKQLEIVVTQ